jgi:membrane-bound lytic murein transglycosylase MltF
MTTTTTRPRATDTLLAELATMIENYESFAATLRAEAKARTAPVADYDYGRGHTNGYAQAHENTAVRLRCLLEKYDRMARFDADLAAMTDNTEGDN